MRIFPIILLVTFSLTYSNTIEDEKYLTKDYTPSSKTDYLFQKFLEHLKIVVKNGSKFLGIPSLDPYKTGPVNKFFNLEDIKGNISADSVAISELSNYQVTRAEIKGLIIRMGFQWLNMEGNMTAYNITNGRFMNFINVFGLGDAVFTLRDFNLLIQITLELKKFKICIKSVESEISLGRFKFDTKGLFNNSYLSEEMSAVISDIGPEIVRYYQEDLTAYINKKIIKIAEKWFGYLTFYDYFNTYLSETNEIFQ